MAAAPGLARSSETFRRSGSSGLVWEDRFAPDDHEGKAKQGTAAADVDKVQEKKKPQPTAYKTADVKPSEDPPSPKVSACGFCSVFGGGGGGSSANKRHKHGTATARR